MDRYNETKLHTLLSRFVSKKLPNQEIVHSFHNFLFCNGSMPKVDDIDLYETMIYLKEIVDINSLKTIDDIILFYDRKKRRLKDFINAITVESFSEVSPLMLTTHKEDVCGLNSVFVNDIQKLNIYYCIDEESNTTITT